MSYAYGFHGIPVQLLSVHISVLGKSFRGDETFELSTMCRVIRMLTARARQGI